MALCISACGQTAFPPATDQEVLDSANNFLAKMLGFTGNIFGSVNEVQRKDHDRINVLETMFYDAFPCVILGLKVENKTVSFSTPTNTCTGWAAYSAQTGLQASRGSFSGTTIGSYDPTRKNAFSFVLPIDHGTVQVMTWDAGGVKQPIRQIEF